MTDKTLFEHSRKVIPGGVNSPVRAFKSVGGDPVFIRRARGPYIYDCDDREYIDYVGSWGPMILGHAHPDVVSAVRDTAANGLSFGAPTELETRMAEKICALIASIDKVRMVNSGTEAAMSAIRLARGYTSRDTIVKFEGCYHGHADSLLVNAGSGALTLGIPTSPGVPADLAKHTLTLTYNDAGQVRELVREHGDHIAAFIVEPVAGNMNCVPGSAEFLHSLREACDQCGAMLIFDEVMSGFRVALGGAQSVYGISPDITILGKVIGGGMPVGAFGGRAEIMDQLAPDGPVYQAGTLSGNPVAMAAGLTTLELVSEPGFFEQLEAKTRALTGGLEAVAKQHGIAFTTHCMGGMFGLFFHDGPVAGFSEVMACNQEQFKRFFHGMLDAGIYLAPSAFEAGFVSSAHTDDDIERTVSCAGKVFQSL